MDNLFLEIVIGLTMVSLLALLFKSRVIAVCVLAIGVALSWYVGFLGVEAFNEIAIEEWRMGARKNFPSDGASNVFALYFGWIPGLLYSSIVFGAGKLVQSLVHKK